MKIPSYDSSVRYHELSSSGNKRKREELIYFFILIRAGNTVAKAVRDLLLVTQLQAVFPPTDRRLSLALATAWSGEHPLILADSILLADSGWLLTRGKTGSDKPPAHALRCSKPEPVMDVGSETSRESICCKASSVIYNRKIYEASNF